VAIAIVIAQQAAAAEQFQSCDTTTVIGVVCPSSVNQVKEATNSENGKFGTAAIILIILIIIIGSGSLSLVGASSGRIAAVPHQCGYIALCGSKPQWHYVGRQGGEFDFGAPFQTLSPLVQSSTIVIVCTFEGLCE
jgi:hypothetical protein